MIIVVLKDLDRYLELSQKAQSGPGETFIRVFDKGTRTRRMKRTEVVAGTKTRVPPTLLYGRRGRAWTILGSDSVILGWESNLMDRVSATTVERLYASGHLEGRVEALEVEKEEITLW